MTERRILVVDDEEDLREILRFNLEKEGFKVDTAASAEEALTLDIASYSLLLLDIMMGEISGMALARVLKRRLTLPIYLLYSSRQRLPRMTRWKGFL